MHQFVVLLTISAMLWHAIVGCCAHHVHADETCRAAERSDREASVTDLSHGCCAHSHTVVTDVAKSDSLHYPADHSQGGSDCAELKCVFVSLSAHDSVELDDSWTQINFLAAIPAETSGCELDSLQLAALDKLFARGAALRLHLALGVLRI